MNYLDEATLVWDAEQSSFIHREKIQQETYFMNTLNLSTNDHEFIKSFDCSSNELVNISSELLITTLKIHTLPEPEDITTLQHQLIKSINKVKEKGAKLSYPVSVIDKLCFLYAVVLDEFIINTTWGEKQGWENKTLLVELFGMRNGGELFFAVAEKTIRQPHKLIDLLEVIYIFINIGFQGQYRGKNKEDLKSFINTVEELIGQYRQHNRIRCVTQVKLPKVRKPINRLRYALTTVFFSILIILSIGSTYVWYNKTLPQRTLDFNHLSTFSERYIHPI
ncbi:DotU family type IV/VI secretion system protein [Vibrio coralliilyticus]|nr:DotU family type IV/VI secretion system protein [Vibrio coralliilyticus]